MMKVHQGRRNHVSTLAGSLLACLVLAGMHPAVASQEYEELVEKGNELFANGEYKKALDAFEIANELAEGKAEVPLLGMAASHYKLKDYGTTIEITQHILQFAEKASQIEAYNMLGMALYMKGMKGKKDKEGLEQAEIAFREAIELIGEESKAVGPRYNLAETLRALGREREAASMLQEILGEGSADGHALADSARIALCESRLSLGAAGEQEPSPSREESRATSSAQQEGETPEERLYVGGEVKAPSKISDPQPQYSVEAGRAHIQGVVIAQVIIDKYGCVTNVKILKGLNSDLNRNAISALSRWVFKPATLNGRPVVVYYNLTVNFRLEDRRN